MPAALDSCQRSFITIRAHQKNADILGMVAGIDGTQPPVPPGTKIVLACKSRGGGVSLLCPVSHIQIIREIWMGNKSSALISLSDVFVILSDNVYLE